MKKLLLCFFLLCLGKASCQDKLRDSLFKIWNNTSKADTVRLMALNDICYDVYLYSDPDSAFYYAQRIYDYAKEKGIKRFQGAGLSTQAVSFYIKGDLSKAIEYHERSLAIYKEINNKKSIAGVRGNLGGIYHKQGQSQKAIENFIETLKLGEELKDTGLIKGALNNIGVIYLEQEDREKAKEYFKRALKLAELRKDKSSLILSLSNLGIIYARENDTAAAFAYYIRGLKIAEEIGNKAAQSTAFSNMGAMERNREKRKAYFLKGLKFAEEAKQAEMLTSALLNLCIEENQEGGNSKQAESYALRALKIAEDMGGVREMANASKCLFEIYERTANYKGAFEMHRLYTKMRDSTVNLEAKTNTLKKEFAYESEKKETANKLLAQENQIQLLQLNQNKFFIITLSGLLVLILLVAFLLFRQIKFRHQRREMLLEQKLLRSQMNPHFIFNSLNAIHSVVLSGDAKTGAKYLGSFSKLIRAILESSRFETISLEKEISLLRNYIDLQLLRFENNIKYTIQVDENIDTENTLLPPMLTQPFIENALEHGLSSTKDGILNISFKNDNGFLIIEVIDNGTGLGDSKNNSEHISLATAITKERLYLLNRGKTKKAIFSVSEAYHAIFDRKGVKILFQIPV